MDPHCPLLWLIKSAPGKSESVGWIANMMTVIIRFYFWTQIWLGIAKKSRCICMLTFEHFWVTFCCNLCKGCSLPLTMLLLAVFLTAFGCGLFIWDYFFTSYLQMGQNRKFENRVSREFIFSIEDETLKSFFHFTYSTWKNFTRNWGLWRERESKS